MVGEEQKYSEEPDSTYDDVAEDTEQKRSEELDNIYDDVVEDKEGGAEAR